MKEVVTFLIENIDQTNYLGIITLMFIESSFFPFPSEVVMIPARYLVCSGKMKFWLVIMSGIIGSLLGAWFNYFLASKFGRNILLKINFIS